MDKATIQKAMNAFHNADSFDNGVKLTFNDKEVLIYDNGATYTSMVCNNTRIDVSECSDFDIAVSIIRITTD